MRIASRIVRRITLATLVASGLAACQLPYTGGARAVRPTEVTAQYIRAAPTPVVRQQQETDCGLAALAMIAGSWGHTWSVVDLAKREPPNERGVRLGALRDLARARGLDAYAIRASHADLEHEIAAGRPVVIGLQLPFARDRRLNHYEVAIAIDPRDGTVVSLDPASGHWMRRTRAVLESEWQPANYAALVVVGELARPMLSNQ